MSRIGKQKNESGLEGCGRVGIVEETKQARNQLEYYYDPLKENQKGLCLEDRRKKQRM